VADDPAKLAAVKGTGKNVVVLQGGANDILAGASASTVWSRLQTYITDAVTAGWQVVVCSIADGTGYSAGQRTEISTLRGLIAAGYAGAGASGYVDLFAAAPALRADGIHYSTAGAITVASAVGAVVDALL
jgi:lysophospholipase L1-like esterase